jgi:hypothetical protein
MIIQNISILRDTITISFDQITNEHIFLSNKLEDRVSPNRVPKLFHLKSENNDIKINMKDLLQTFQKSSHLQLFVLNENKSNLVGYTFLEEVEMSQKKGNNTLRIVCNQNKLLVEIDVVTESVNPVVTQVSDTEFEFIGGGDYSEYIVSARKRISGNVFDYFAGDIELPIHNNGFALDLAKLTADPLFDGDIYNFYIKNRKNEYVQIKVSGLENKSINVNPSMKYKFYKTGRETLAIHFSPINNFYATKIEATPNVLSFSLNTAIKKASSILLINYSDKGYIKTDFLEFNLNGESDLTHFELPIEISELCAEFSHRDIVIGVKVKESDSSFIHLIKYPSEASLLSMIDEVEVSMKKGNQNECVIHCLTLKSKDQINIAVLGSCYTRRLFSSTHFFNRQYKNRYSVVHTQFHSSLISLADDQQTKFNPDLFHDFEPVALDYVKTDFEKTFFQKLKEAQPDYFLIDAYTDFQMGTFIFPDGRKVTGSTYILKRAEFLHSQDLEGVQFISPFDHPDFFTIWKESAERFCQKLIEVIPEERVIIHFINPNTEYKDGNGTVKNYTNNPNRTFSLIYIADYMHNYLKKLLPKAQIIDSRFLPYIGDEKTPDGLLIHHFETGYYKEVLKLIDQAIVRSVAREKGHNESSIVPLAIENM